MGVKVFMFTIPLVGEVFITRFPFNIAEELNGSRVGSSYSIVKGRLELIFQPRFFGRTKNEPTPGNPTGSGSISEP